jgi:hypothetical protein
MSTSSKLAAVAFVALAGIAAAQLVPSSLKVNLPADSPVGLISADWGESRTSERGSAMVLDLHTALSLRNASQRRIRGITLLVTSQEVTPGGRASVTKASLDIGPGETFPLRVDLRLLRPLTRGSGPLVEMSLDGVLFDDLSFYGPNRLDSRRAMTAFELEAQRDRRYLWSVLQSGGPEALRQECLSSLARQADTPRLDVQVARARATNVDPGEQHVTFAFLRFPDAPVEPVAGFAQVAGGEARAPRLEVLNRSQRAVRYLELGWILKDRQGREYLAASMPAELALPPGQRGNVLGQAWLKFAEPTGAPLAIGGMTGFISQVEFADGTVWIPSRTNLSDPQLQRALLVSPEEQRLTGIYRKRGLQGVADELKRLAGGSPAVR